MDVILRIDGRLHAGWTTAKVTRSMENIADLFQLSLTDRWSEQGDNFQISLGMPVQVLLDGELVLSGHTEDVRLSYTATEHRIEVGGRSSAGDLVDCSLPGQSFKGQSLAAIAATLGKPFGIGVDDQVSDPKAFDLQLEPGQSLFEFLDGAAKERGVMLHSRPDGALVIARAGARHAGVDLVEGVNILSASANRSSRRSHSEITVEPQDVAYTNVADPDVAAVVSATEDHPDGMRYRPKVILPSSRGDAESAQGRATAEMRYRMSKDNRFTITVFGWRENGDTGPLWDINQRIRVASQKLQLAGDELLIVGVEFTVGQNGTQTQLELSYPQLFEHKPLKKIKKGAAGDPNL